MELDADASVAASDSAPKPRKRNTSGAGADGGGGDASAGRRAKRSKYTSMACDECKKRKLKCIPTDDANCERCVAGGLACAFASAPAPAPKENKQDDSHHLQTLTQEVFQLRQQVADLVGVVRDLKDQPQEAPTVSSHSRETVFIQSPVSTHRSDVPKQPQFVGPTRSDFGILIGERSLNRMGIPTYEPPTGPQSPDESTAAKTTTDFGYWDRCTASEIARCLMIFQEEVESVYPFTDIGEYAIRSQEILDAIRSGNTDLYGPFQSKSISSRTLDSKDLGLVRVAMATGMVIEAHGKNDLSASIVEPVERDVSCFLTPQVDLKEIQLLTMLSIYYFHSDEELLAWRTIGIAAREILEMGLHRKRGLLDNFIDPDSRRLAIRVFWCVYVLDRRWSFGTSLSFALNMKDLDPELPKPCMIGYGDLSSKLWDAIPPFGSPSQTIPDDTAAALDLCAQDWLESIPTHLQLRHPRLGLAPRSQPQLLHRLRALLYLRGNYARILIYRHHLMSAASIAASPRSAWLVVDIAQDTIQVLVHLHATSDIYSRQQNAFNYFLLSALAVVFLAVCHAPATFAGPCRKNFLEGVDLVKGLSRNSIISRRLWKSIRGLIPRIRSLGMQGEEDKSDEPQVTGDKDPDHHDLPNNDTNGGGEANGHISIPVHDHSDFPLGEMMLPDTEIAHSVPDMYQMRDDLLSLFDAFGQGQQLYQSLSGQFPEGQELMVPDDDGEEISRRFQGLI
ncbi:activator of stress 1 [Fusarium albosuccineum]|uniref:Activator of stress 1 n=1 Tax=Fusarium albosuccineum TaxID=1237068 RepID=A0A8H4L938_9HYPO|nr:activator of stress 1 [Fusarium albosuccineum]